MDAGMWGIILGVVGILTGVLVSWYFYKKGKRKTSLRVLLEYQTQIFSNIDPDLKNHLVITYDDVEVENLHQVQFIVINDGTEPISDIREPLTLTVPFELLILDA